MPVDPYDDLTRPELEAALRALADVDTEGTEAQCVAGLAGLCNRLYHRGQQHERELWQKICPNIGHPRVGQRHPAL